MFEYKMKDLAWNTFKKTGDINTFLEFIQIENIEKNLTEHKNIKETWYGNNKNKRDYNFRK